MLQIKIQDLLPLLRPGWVAMDEDGRWWWYSQKPYIRNEFEFGNQIDMESLCAFSIAPYDGDWENSLMECGK